ncbi:hypothetical protein ACHAQH_009854 [Verticillium albo-atrum]
MRDRDWLIIAGPNESDMLCRTDSTHDPGSASCDRTNAVERPPQQPEGDVIHYGLTTSGDRILKSATKRVEAVSRLGDVLYFEMEAVGLMSELPCIDLRGMSDYVDFHKNDEWHDFAAGAAVVCNKKLLSYFGPQIDSDVPADPVTMAPEPENGRLIVQSLPPMSDHPLTNGKFMMLFEAVLLQNKQSLQVRITEQLAIPLMALLIPSESLACLITMPG